MENLIVFLLIIPITLLISILWVRGIDNMKKNYPNYKGEDYLHWDDNKSHTEDEF
jgi:hypothetical protein